MGFELLEMNDDLYGLLNEVIREREELIDRLESCRMALDDMREHCEEFKAEVRRMKEERDDAIEHADCEMQFAEGLKAERDEARKCAEQMRDLYAAEVDESKKAFPWPWEADVDEPKRIDGKPAGMSAEQFDACYEEDDDADAD